MTIRIIFSILVACSFVLSTQSYANASFQPDADTEQTETFGSINESLQNNISRYGSWLFSGSFSQHSFSATNPDYKITQGDQLLVQVWGGIDYQAEVQVDPQGNIFIPKVGPIKVLGVTNDQLNQVILSNVKRVYKSNVEVYASLMSSQTVKVFVAGMVNNPGLYEGQSADSILRFIDQAKGIRNDIGSYRNIKVIRNNHVLSQVDLYQFLQSGMMPIIQLQDGDTIFIAPKQGEVILEGAVGYQGRYELTDQATLESILGAVTVSDQATHVTVISSSSDTLSSKSIPSESMLEAPNRKVKNREVNATQYPIEDINQVEVTAGSIIKVTAQLRPNSISIDLIGEHNSAQEMVLPWGASLQNLLDTVEFSMLSNPDAIQLYRASVAERQKEMLQASLSSLEQSVLTARSGTREAAELRKVEAETILRWIEKAKQVQPKGQVLLTNANDLSSVILQQGDQVVIPAKRNLVIIHGEVMFPTAVAYNDQYSAKDFIAKAGGTRKDLKDMNILVRKPNGSFETLGKGVKKAGLIGPGDEIFVLSPPDKKTLQFGKDIVQIMFQIATTAAVFLRI